MINIRYYCRRFAILGALRTVVSAAFTGVLDFEVPQWGPVAKPQSEGESEKVPAATHFGVFVHSVTF